MKLWLNPASGVLAACEQLEPILLNGQVQRGKRNGEFVHNPRGIDILHRTVSGQLELDEDDSRIRSYRGLPALPSGTLRR